ncbi:hypothetical protein [Aureispira anguillae]|uniref:EGF-like domain-containing protein n=1 Tax=Aureispira anguillae TaxID=2864201 RepID=A0A915YJF4_9BACT|nr:hypothetical protein [Aureispira anguillae]BDS14294.1 hypothetical protein AsAng_0050730 [Aureispira anguillae]
MNHILRLCTTLVFFFFVFTSCETDPCENISCDKGVCDAVSGKCICSRGYQADDNGICTILWTAKFANSYAVSDSCTGPNAGTHHYNSTITAIDAENLSLSNFGNTGRSIPAKHTNSTSFEINLSSHDTIFSGTGSLVDTTLIVNYMIHDTTNHRIDTCTATFNPL